MENASKNPKALDAHLLFFPHPCSLFSFHGAMVSAQDSPRCRREVDLPSWFGRLEDMEEEEIPVPNMQAKEIGGGQ